MITSNVCISFMFVDININFFKSSLKKTKIKIIIVFFLLLKNSRECKRKTIAKEMNCQCFFELFFSHRRRVELNNDTDKHYINNCGWSRNSFNFYFCRVLSHLMREYIQQNGEPIKSSFRLRSDVFWRKFFILTSLISAVVLSC